MAFALLLVGCSVAPHPPLQNDAIASFVGKRYLFHYDSGLQVEAYYVSDEQLQWKALTGPSAGTSGNERIYTITLAPHLYFISWVESNGTTVSNVVDLSRVRVASFVTFQGATARQALTDEGSIHEIAAP